MIFRLARALKSPLNMMRRWVPANRCPPYYPRKYLIPGFIYGDIKHVSEEKDWVVLGAVNIFKRRANLRHCYAVVAASALESADALFGGKGRLDRYAFEELVEYEIFSHGHYGGSVESCFDYIVARGGLIRHCDFDPREPTFKKPHFGKMIGYQKVPDDFDSFLKALSCQPVALTLNVTEDLSMFEGKTIPLEFEYDEIMNAKHIFLGVAYSRKREVVRLKCPWDGGIVELGFKEAISAGILEQVHFPVFRQNYEAALQRRGLMEKVVERDKFEYDYGLKDCPPWVEQLFAEYKSPYPLVYKKLR